MAELEEEYGDRVGFLGLLLDFNRANSTAVRLAENAGVTFINVDGFHRSTRSLYELVQTGFVPTAGLIDSDGAMIGDPIRGGVPGYRDAIEAALNR